MKTRKTVQHKGQVALILVLIMTVVSALAVSLASRSTVDTRIQESESEGVQALLFAQTGLEQLIMNPAPSTAPDPNFFAVMSEVGSESVETGIVPTGSIFELNLEEADYGKLSAFSVYWGPDEANQNGKPAIFISLVESTGKITDYAYDYDGLNGFTPATVVSGSYPRTSGNILLNNRVRKVRFTALGTAARFRIVPVGSGAIFPSQIRSIKSVGSVASDNNTVKYGLQYDESATPGVPPVFDYALFSGGSISQ
jgi:hypothetical protein